MNTTLPNIFDAYKRVKEIIESCTHPKQIPSCRRLIRAFKTQYEKNINLRLLDQQLDITINVKRNTL